MDMTTYTVNGTGWNTTVTTAIADREMVVWPQWVEITVPLICITVFIVTLVVIFMKPSKPGDEPIYSLVFKSKNREVVFVTADSGDEPVKPDKKNKKDFL